MGSSVPPVNLTLTVRCVSKSLSSSGAPSGGTVDTVNAVLTLVSGSANGSAPTGTLNMTYPLASDVFKIGNYYSMAVTDGVAPASAKEEHDR